MAEQWRESPPRPMCMALWALARMGHQPTEEWLHATLSHVVLHTVLYSTPEVWRRKRVLSLMPVVEGAGTEQPEPELHAYRLVQPNSARDAAAVAAKALLGRPSSDRSPVSAEWLQQVRFHALLHRRYGGMTGQQYMMVMYSVATLQYRPSDKWMGAFYSGLGALLARQALLDMHELRLHDVEGAQRYTPWHREGGQDLQPPGQRQQGKQGRQHELKRPEYEDSEQERLRWQGILQLIQRGQQQRRGHGGGSGSGSEQQGQGSSSSSQASGKVHPPLVGPGSSPDPSSCPQLVGPRDLACLLWSLARVRHEPPTWWVRLYEAVLMPRLSSFSVQVRGVGINGEAGRGTSAEP